jgi:metallophosphoesterase (TIGR00282 family)
MRILMIGDVFGKPGRKTLAKILPELKKKKKIDLVIANAENAHHGKGVSDSKIKEMRGYGVDFFTSGNHIWRIAEIYTHMEKTDYPLIRPANYPEGAPGRGYAVIEISKQNVLIINLMGRVFMPGHLDDPFRKIENILAEVKKKGYKLGKNLSAIIVDMHAETGSEKMAMGHFLDGKVSVVYGTHTHIQTADEQLLPKGTAYLTDVGMTGVINSIIGARKEEIIENFLTQLPVKHEVAEGDTVFNALLLETDKKTGLAKSIERIQIRPVSV